MVVLGLKFLLSIFLKTQYPLIIKFNVAEPLISNTVLIHSSEMLDMFSYKLQFS